MSRFISSFAVAFSLLTPFFAQANHGDFEYSRLHQRLSRNPLQEIQNPKYLEMLLSDIQVVRAELKVAEQTKEVYRTENYTLNLSRIPSTAGLFAPLGPLALIFTSAKLLDGIETAKKWEVQKFAEIDSAPLEGHIPEWTNAQELETLRDIKRSYEVDIAKWIKNTVRDDFYERELHSYRERLASTESQIQKLEESIAAQRNKVVNKSRAVTTGLYGAAFLSIVAAMNIGDRIAKSQFSTVELTESEKQVVETYLDTAEKQIHTRLVEIQSKEKK